MTAPRALPRRRPPAGPHRWRALLVGTLATLLLGAGTLPAQAHDGLVGTVPLNTELVPAAPTTVELTFTGEPLPLGTEVQVVGPDGALASTGAPEIRGTSVVQPLAASLPAGDYTVQWRSTSSDGHPLTGTFTFSIAAGGPVAAGSPADPATTSAATGGAAAGTTVTPDPQSATAPVANQSDTGLPTGWLVAAAVVLAAVGALVALRLRRRA